MLQSTTALLIFILILSFLAVHIRRMIVRGSVNPGRLPLPPGPPRLPVIGNLLDVPTESPWLKFASMAQTYGDVMHLSVLGKSIIVLGSKQTITDLLEKRSTKYSHRPEMIMMTDLIGWDWNFSFMPYGSLWRRHRRAFHKIFSAAAVTQYHPAQVQETRRFLRNLRNTPEIFFHHIRQLTAGSILLASYGIQITENDEFSSIAECAMEGLGAAAIPGAFLVDIYPFLKYIPSWIPGVTFKKKAEYWRSATSKMATWPWNVVKDALRHGTATQSIAAKLMEDLPIGSTPGEEEIFRRDMLGVAFGAAADTTVSALQTFFLAMSLHPEAQRRAQAELDAVVGPGRLPTIEDSESLPYVNAVINETLRWQPVGPLAVPHCTSEDDEYHGFYIPKGAIVVGNAWAVLHDAAIYPEPAEFKPERFLKDGKLNPETQDPRIVSFGFGRRICPGKDYAETMLFSVISSVLQVYDISHAVDMDGFPVPIAIKMGSHAISLPAPFQCSIKARSATAEELIQA